MCQKGMHRCEGIHASRPAAAAETFCAGYEARGPKGSIATPSAGLCCAGQSPLPLSARACPPLHLSATSHPPVKGEAVNIDCRLGCGTALAGILGPHRPRERDAGPQQPALDRKPLACRGPKQDLSLAKTFSP